MCQTSSQQAADPGLSREFETRLASAIGLGKPMRSASLVTAILFVLVAAAARAAAPPPPLAAEHQTVEPLPPRGPHWVYVFDVSFSNEIDQRIHLFDADTHRRLGQIDMGFYPAYNLSPDGATSVVATTYFARGSRGARTDVVEFTDNATLAVTREIVLPNKRAMTLPTPYSVAYSPDGHLLFTSYVTPAASFGVLDPVHGKVLGEVDTAGCVLVIPSGNYRVSSICESGRLLTVTLDGDGHETARAMSEPFFDADKDPIFVQGVATKNGQAFVSFLGDVHEVDLSGAQPAFAPAWSLVSAAERGHWRVGGTEPATWHRGLGRLYVSMHQGGEGTHKDPGAEIWVFDTATHKRLARWPMHAPGPAEVLALHVTQDAAPVLFAATKSADVAVLDALSGKVKHVERALGQSPWMMFTP